MRYMLQELPTLSTECPSLLSWSTRALACTYGLYLALIARMLVGSYLHARAPFLSLCTDASPKSSRKDAWPLRLVSGVRQEPERLLLHLSCSMTSTQLLSGEGSAGPAGTGARLNEKGAPCVALRAVLKV